VVFHVDRGGGTPPPASTPLAAVRAEDLINTITTADLEVNRPRITDG
jgi:hypothetical protein